MSHRAVLTLLATFMINFVFGQKISPVTINAITEKVDSLVQSKNDKPFNGVIYITHKGKEIYSKAQGYADLEKERPLTLNDQFVIGSISKQITAVLVLQEYEKGNIKLDEPIATYLPEIPSDWKHIVTVHHLLTHTHGITEVDQPVSFVAGTKFAYSQIGYELLANILEKVKHKNFKRISTEFFIEHGLKNTFHPFRKRYKRLVKGYSEQTDGEIVYEKNSLISYVPAGSFISNAKDLALWNQLLNNGELLKESTYQLMAERYATRQHPIFGSLEYGYGITFRKYENKFKVGALGFAPGFVSLNYYFPTKGISVAVLQNIARANIEEAFYFHTEILDLISEEVSDKKEEHSLYSFFTDNELLENEVNAIFETLSEEQRVAQMIITSIGEHGKPEKTVKDLVTRQKVGAVIFMSNQKEKHILLRKELDSIAHASGSLPLIFSMDAEPSLLAGRIKGAEMVLKTIELRTEHGSSNAAKIIDKELKDIGIHINYAPVADISSNNEAITNRSYGNNPDSVVLLSKAFIRQSQNDGIIATAKHFPGHGLVKGNTHDKTVYIDGELAELDVFRQLIKDSVLSVMVAHLVIKNNSDYDTDGLPATLSPKIVTQLLQVELGFKGIIVTDALNIMKAVTKYENAPLLASKAGNDMLLMPIDEQKTIDSILKEMENDPIYRQQVYKSVKKIIKFKVVLGLI